MSEFASQQCKAEVSPLSDEAIETALEKISPEWVLNTSPQSISRTFKFKNYYETMAFVNVVAAVAHQQDHHPEMNVSYNTCQVTFNTHSVGGLSDNDFICAARVDRCLSI
jgi:4a-hydroxytetrahydrobiopterin dehydratase